MNNDTLTITCSCGCDNGYNFNCLDGTIYISMTVGYYYAAQHPIRCSFRERFELVTGKSSYIGGAVLGRGDIERIIAWLRNHKCNDDKGKNYGRLVLFPLFSPEEKGTENEIYELCVEPVMSKIAVLSGQLFRAGEIILNEKNRRGLIVYLKNVLKG